MDMLFFNLQVKEKYRMIIENVGLHDEGIYTCIAKNRYGSAKQEYNVTVWQKLSFLEELSSL